MGVKYRWNTGDTLQKIWVNEVGKHYFKVKLYTSCDSVFAQKSVYIYGNPKPTFPEDTIVCMKDSIVLYAGNNLQYHTWLNGELDPTVDSISVTENGLYSILYDDFICFQQVFSTNVYFEGENGGFNNANIFTPNGDEFNEVFKIYESNTDEFQLEIFNRWGKRVFFTENPKEYWNAENTPDGVYFYSLHFKNCQGEVVKKKGTVSVNR